MKTKLTTQNLFPRCPWRALACLLGVSLLACAMQAAAETEPALLPLSSPFKVAIDAGHGGDDPGVRGGSGSLEKEVTLQLAQIMAGLHRDRLQVVLTRDGDQGLDLYERTARANNSGADLLISLHAGASPMRQSREITIYYHDPELTASPLLQGMETQAKSDGDYPPWEHMQQAYHRASHNLADTLRAALARHTGLPIAKIHGAPMAVLAGAAMPAVIIEIGLLTNPEQEKTLQDPAFLAELAGLITQGLIDFYNNSSALKPLS